tara:strand:+ start:89 stop:295 length:207 start_codon:yes stop_codon:yes gene_type:complete
MSKKYQDRARKRESMHFIDAKSLCKFQKSHNEITCDYCLHRVGVTREKQKRQGQENVGPIRYNRYLCF